MTLYCTACGCEMGPGTACRIENMRSEDGPFGRRLVFDQRCHGKACPDAPFVVFDGPEIPVLSA